MATTGWNLNGLDLRRVGYNIESVGGWDGFPASKIGRFSHGFRHGDVLGSKGFYTRKTMSLGITIFPTNPDGTVTLQPEEHVQQNLDSIMGALHARDRLVPLQKTFGAGPTTREIQVAALTAVPASAGFGVQGRRVVLVFECPYPLWHELPLVSLASPASLTNNGNAPVGDAILTCTSAGRLTNTTTGDWVESSAANVVINTLTGSITQAGAKADQFITQGQEWFPDFEPGVNNLTITGAWTIDYYHTYF